ncbi:MAG: DUF4236 domain-containing protein [Actinomycetota bacterium]|nr:DUF4236 domain-containing protein [Actinomycetota bacterium]
MGLGFRRSKKLGPFRVTLTHRGLSGSVGAGPARVGRSTSGRRTTSFRLGKGLFWRRSRNG